MHVHVMKLGAGIGAENEGPPAPTVIQTVTQDIKDVTGIPINYVWYGGLALIGWFVYKNYFDE